MCTFKTYNYFMWSNDLFHLIIISNIWKHLNSVRWKNIKTNFLFCKLKQISSKRLYQSRRLASWIKIVWLHTFTTLSTFIFNWHRSCENLKCPSWFTNPELWIRTTVIYKTDTAWYLLSLSVAPSWLTASDFLNWSTSPQE